MRSVVAILKLFAFVLVNIALVPPHTIIYLVHKGRGLHVIPKLYHTLACAIFQIRISHTGQPVADRQTLFMSNHISYLDIPLLSTRIPRPHFVAKKDVKDWPVWGFLAKLQQTAFISRNPADAYKETQSLDAMVRDGKNLVIFAEGTSTDGTSVLPFKSSLFKIAFGEHSDDLCVQPVTLRVKAINGVPSNGGDPENLYAWPRELDMELIPHLWRFAKSKGAEIEVIFHNSVKPNAFSDRKTLAKACCEAVCNGLESS
jgi:1-acyl-sn-glycerol-3-phosphate acyltransferase